MASRGPLDTIPGGRSMSRMKWLASLVAFLTPGFTALFAPPHPVQTTGTAIGAAMMDISHYCNEDRGGRGCVTCCGKWARAGRTKSGRRPVQGVSCAAPPQFPFGTWIEIEGVGYRRVDDRTSPKYYHRIDLYVGSWKGAHAHALKLGLLKRRWVRLAPLHDPTAVRRKP